VEQQCSSKPSSAERGVPLRRVMFEPGQMVRVNLAGMQVKGVLFHAAVTDAVGHIVRQSAGPGCTCSPGTREDEPPMFLVKLLFSFKGVSEVEVPAERIHAA